MRVTVTADQRHVAIDGHVLSVEMASSVWMDLRAMRWDPSIADWPGFIEYQDGRGHGFKDFERVQTFVEAWQRAKAIDDENKAAAEAHRKAAETRRKAEEDAERAKFEAATAEQARALDAQKPLYDALNALAASDHEVIKAVETQLIAAGAIDAELVAKRQAWRETVKAERAKAV